jgi:hypothetical protein
MASAYGARRAVAPGARGTRGSPSRLRRVVRTDVVRRPERSEELAAGFGRSVCFPLWIGTVEAKTGCGAGDELVVGEIARNRPMQHFAVVLVGVGDLDRNGCPGPHTGDRTCVVERDDGAGGPACTCDRERLDVRREAGSRSVRSGPTESADRYRGGRGRREILWSDARRRTLHHCARARNSSPVFRRRS